MQHLKSLLLTLNSCGSTVLVEIITGQMLNLCTNILRVHTADGEKSQIFQI